MKIGIDEVRYVAHLARLELGDDEAAGFAAQLDEILGYIDKLGELDVTGVEPTRHALEIVNAFRDDAVRESFDADTALSNAPESHENYFKVPKIIE